MPRQDNFYEPCLTALREMGGSASNQALLDHTLSLMALPQDVLDEPHLGSETKTEVQYRLEWAKTKLKKAGLIMNARRGVWGLTPAGRHFQGDLNEHIKKANSSQTGQEAALEELEDEADWQETLLSRLQALSPAGFERFCQRFLRESGFDEVIVTGKSGDDGIDGRGIMRLGELLSFSVIFQAKRWKGAVGSAEVRNLRGAMSGQADKALLITTSRFTTNAQKEASRVTPPIDLVDGARLCERLRDLGLGVREHIEVVSIPEFFEEFE